MAHVCVCLVWYMCMGVGEGECSKGTAEKKERSMNRKKGDNVYYKVQTHNLVPVKQLC